MSEDSRKPPHPSPPSLPPSVPFELESNWDDDTLPRLELDDPMSESAFDRVTAIPELPAELYAKQMMAEHPADAVEDPEPPPSTSHEPPLTAGPAHNAAGPTSITTRPGRSRDPAVAWVDADSAAPTSPGSPETAPPVRDPADPLLELDLDLAEVARSAPPPQVLVPSPPTSRRGLELREMKDRYAMGDFTGALAVAEGMLEGDPEDIDAQRYAQSCRDVLTQMYSARLGTLTQRVRVAVPGDQIRWLSLDHRAGFVLSLIDGSSTVEELLDISGMNRLDALRILYTLFDQRVIALG